MRGGKATSAARRGTASVQPATIVSKSTNNFISYEEVSQSNSKLPFFRPLSGGRSQNRRRRSPSSCFASRREKGDTQKDPGRKVGAGGGKGGGYTGDKKDFKILFLAGASQVLPPPPPPPLPIPFLFARLVVQNRKGLKGKPSLLPSYLSPSPYSASNPRRRRML